MLLDLLKTWTWDDNGRRKSPLTAVTYKGRPAWIGVQVGEALEYQPGAKLTEMMRAEWTEEFTEGVDFDILRGADLAEFKKLVADGGLTTNFGVSKNTQALMLIYESGMWKALMLTKKPAGKRLRKWLGETVMPEIAATGGYISGATPQQAASLFADLHKRMRSLEDGTAQRLNVLEAVTMEGRQQTGQALTLASRATEDAAVMGRVVQHLSDRLGYGAYEDGRIGERQAKKITTLIGEVAAGRGLSWQAINVELREREDIPQAMRWEDVPVTHMARLFTWLERQIERYPRSQTGGQGSLL